MQFLGALVLIGYGAVLLKMADQGPTQSALVTKPGVIKAVVVPLRSDGTVVPANEELTRQLRAQISGAESDSSEEDGSPNV